MLSTALPRGRTTLLGLALAVGAGAGLAAIVFRFLITEATTLLSGSSDPSGTTGHPVHHWLPWLGPAFILLAPVVGGLLYGPLLQRFAPEARGHGVPEVMLAVAQRGGRIPGRVAVVKALASALCIGSGGSVGREGPIVQIGSALGSRIGQVLHLPEARLRTLVACGAAGGIAATFNAPLAGVFFALELLLRDFTADSFGLVVLAAVVASAIGRAAFGNDAFLQLPGFELRHPQEYLLYALLGVLAGVAGVLFTRVLYAVEDVCDWAWRWPEWARPAVGGLLLGLLLLVLPQMYGVGYPVLQKGVAGKYGVVFLLVLLVGKILATSLTIGIGGSGGVFAPSLFVGAMLGAAFGEVTQTVLPGTAGPVGAYALIGMGAVFAGSARAPITAVLILFELTGEYSIILPLMLAIVLATAISARLSSDTVYTLKLRRRGIDVTSSTSGAPDLQRRRVKEVLDPAPEPLSADLALRPTAHRLLRGAGVLPVVDDDGKVLGVVTARAVSEALASDVSETTTAGDLVEEPPRVSVSTSLAEALDLLVGGDTSGLPVIDEHGRLAGWLSHRGLLSALAGPPTPPVQPRLAVRREGSRRSARRAEAAGARPPTRAG